MNNHDRFLNKEETGLGMGFTVSGQNWTRDRKKEKRGSKRERPGKDDKDLTLGSGKGNDQT